MTRLGILMVTAVVLGGCATPPATTVMTAETSSAKTSSGDKASTVVVLASEVEWQQLNPLRGDASPMAANLWGDRNSEGPSGFLVRFVDGFASPPHIHNVSYRGVVVHGRVHNDAPSDERMWMPTGSFWTQPKGAAHITAAKSPDVVLAYIEIDEGPYLVRPTDDAFSSQEQPLNVDASNIAWVDALSAPESTSATAGSQIALLWGDPNDNLPRGILVKLPAQSTHVMRGPTLQAVVIQGEPVYQAEGGEVAMEAGSYVSSNTKPVQLSCRAETDCVLYVRLQGDFKITPVPR